MRPPLCLRPEFREEAEPLLKLCKDGLYEFQKEWCCWLDGEMILIPPERLSDGSSWKGWLPGPNRRVIARAGYVHDEIWKTGHLGTGGRKVGYFEGNAIWFKVAIAGSPETRCPLPWAIIGWLGLTLFGWWSYWGYRRKD